VVTWSKSRASEAASAPTPKHTEGVGESRDYESSSRVLLLARWGRPPTSSSPSPINGSDEARAPVSPTPPGRRLGRQRLTAMRHRASTGAGPFDAVIDVVRSRRLMRGARLLLLPAPGLLSALLRCLRCLPSLLRHAALLA